MMGDNGLETRAVEMTAPESGVGRCGLCDCSLTGRLIACPQCGRKFHDACFEFAGGCVFCGRPDLFVPVRPWLILYRLGGLVVLAMSLTLWYCIGFLPFLYLVNRLAGVTSYSSHSLWFCDVVVSALPVVRGLLSFLPCAYLLVIIPELYLRSLVCKRTAEHPERLRPLAHEVKLPAFERALSTCNLVCALSVFAILTLLQLSVSFGPPAPWFVAGAFVPGIFCAVVLACLSTRFLFYRIELAGAMIRVMNLIEMPDYSLLSVGSPGAVGDCDPTAEELLPAGMTPRREEDEPCPFEFLEATDKGERDNTPRCPVCGEAVTDRIVRCESCDTPHHRECWEYAGGCAIFGCRRKEHPVATAEYALLMPVLSGKADRWFNFYRFSWGCFATAVAGMLAALWGHVTSIAFTGGIAAYLASCLYSWGMIISVIGLIAYGLALPGLLSARTSLEALIGCSLCPPPGEGPVIVNKLRLPLAERLGLFFARLFIAITIVLAFILPVISLPEGNLSLATMVGFAVAGVVFPLAAYAASRRRLTFLQTVRNRLEASFTRSKS